MQTRPKKVGEANGKVIGEMLNLKERDSAALRKLNPEAAARKYGACPRLIAAYWQDLVKG
jgi:hypothetical protein